MSSAFELWVQSTECFEILRICARQVSIRAERIGIVLDDSHIAKENREDYLSAVASDLWQFIKGNAETIAKQATILLLSGDEAAFMTFVSQKFLDHCIDERRTTSPFQSYYRKMRTLLHKASEDGAILYEAKNRKGAYYAYSISTDIVTLPDTFSGTDYSTWHTSKIPFTKVYDSSAMLGLSRHFWDESLREFLSEYLLPIRELVSFVCAKYPLMLTVDYQDAQGESDIEGESGISLENRLVDTVAAINALDDSWKRQRPVIEADVIDTQLHSIAHDCAAEMTYEERSILVQIDAGETLEAIKTSLGFKTASNVSYHQKKAYQKIHTKWSLWGPSSIKQFAEVDEEEFFMFYEKVLSSCKIDKTCRDSRKGTEV